MHGITTINRIKLIKWVKFRHFFQMAGAVFFNLPFLAPCLKHLPVPVFNCYACPLASGACPIGTLQHFMIIRVFPSITIGVLGLTGLLSGRLICGFLCPFGFFNDLIFKIKSIKLQMRNSIYLKYLKYMILIALVFLIPYFTKEPWFSKLCPLGILQGGIPSVIIDTSLRPLVGYFFYFKIFILTLTIVVGILIERFWCRFICPLGAIYGLFNSISILRLNLDSSKCKKCNQCSTACPINLSIFKELNSTECIRCLQCMKQCKNISFGVKL